MLSPKPHLEVAKNIYVEGGMFNLGRANPPSCILGGFVSNVGFTSQSFVHKDCSRSMAALARGLNGGNMAALN